MVYYGGISTVRKTHESLQISKSANRSIITATFNALCVLCGATALNRQDLHHVVPDPRIMNDMIRRGLRVAHDIALKGGLKAQQSARFLQKLVRATNKRDETVRSKSSSCFQNGTLTLVLKYF